MKLVKRPVFSKNEKELECEREMKRSKRTEQGEQILELNFEVSEEESLETPPENGTQTDSKLFVDTCTPSEEFDYLFNTPNIQPPFDQLEFQNDNEKVKSYTGLPSFYILNTVFQQVPPPVTRKARNLTTFEAET